MATRISWVIATHTKTHGCHGELELIFVHGKIVIKLSLDYRQSDWIAVRQLFPATPLQTK